MQFSVLLRVPAVMRLAEHVQARRLPVYPLEACIFQLSIGIQRDLSHVEY
jgi:hypothetical protein